MIELAARQGFRGYTWWSCGLRLTAACGEAQTESFCSDCSGCEVAFRSFEVSFPPEPGLGLSETLASARCVAARSVGAANGPTFQAAICRLQDSRPDKGGSVRLVALGLHNVETWNRSLLRAVLRCCGCN